MLLAKIPAIGAVRRFGGGTIARLIAAMAITQAHLGRLAGAAITPPARKAPVVRARLLDHRSSTSRRTHWRKSQNARGSVSRVLSTARKRMGGHSSRRRIAPPLQQPTRTASAAAGRRPYSVLLPVGFAVPAAVAGAAVRSYRTLSLSRFRGERDLLSVALSLGSPPPGITRHRRCAEPGLSSPDACAPAAAARSSGLPHVAGAARRSKSRPSRMARHSLSI